MTDEEGYLKRERVSEADYIGGTCTIIVRYITYLLIWMVLLVCNISS